MTKRIVETFRINRKIFLVLAFSLALISIFLTGLHYWQSMKELEDSEKRNTLLLESRFYNIVNNAIDFYRSRAQANINSHEVMQYIKENDHDRLYATTKGRWSILQKENPHLKVMQYHKAEGTSLLRLHDVNRYGDPIAQKRQMLQHIHSRQKEIYGFETGVAGLAYRYIYPIFDENHYLGALEFGFNADYFKDALKKWYDLDSSILIALNSHATQPKNSHRFNNYFVNLEGDPNAPLIQALPKDYDFKTNKRITLAGKTYSVHAFNLNMYNGQVTGKILLFDDITETLSTLNRSLLYSSLLTVIVGVLATFILAKILSSVVESLEEARVTAEANKVYLRTVLDTQSNIVVVTDGYEIVDTNQAFFDFFPQFSNLNEFKKEYNCICDFFIPDEGFLSKESNGIVWVDKVIYNPERIHLAKMRNQQGEVRIFEVNAKQVRLRDKDKKVAVFYDTTLEQYAKAALEQKAKDEEERRKYQETLLVQQSKMASMGQMMEIIIHQWRQPLNALAIILQDLDEAYKYNEINDDYIEKYEESAMRQIHFMSSTIDDFRSFFRHDNIQKEFALMEAVTSVTSLLKPTLKKFNVSVEFHGDEGITLMGYPNEFKQAILNIINNAKEACSGPDKEGKIVISIYEKENRNILRIADNGTGFTDEKKLFVPYYTTKGEQGTGLGLIMTKQIVEKIEGAIIAYNDPQTGGAVFELSFPIPRISEGM